MLRVGQGYDLHKLKKGRDLILCGEKIPFKKGLWIQPPALQLTLKTSSLVPPP